MTDNIKITDTKTEIPEITANPDQKPTLRYVLEQIEKIAAQSEYLNQTIDRLGNMSDGEPGEACSPGNIAGQAKAQALGDVVRCRETTNQQLLKFYEKIYDDLKKQPDSVVSVTKKFDELTSWMKSIDWAKLPQEAKSTIQNAVMQQLSRNW